MMLRVDIGWSHSHSSLRSLQCVRVCLVLVYTTSALITSDRIAVGSNNARYVVARLLRKATTMMIAAMMVVRVLHE